MEMVKFICKNCNYRYQSENEQSGKACPYCGKKEVIGEPYAEDLLKEE
jgi:DNA-directed RNA polymerase subunit RPC12/RpoP